VGAKSRHQPSVGRIHLRQSSAIQAETGLSGRLRRQNNLARMRRAAHGPRTEYSLPSGAPSNRKLQCRWLDLVGGKPDNHNNFYYCTEFRAARRRARTDHLQGMPKLYPLHTLVAKSHRRGKHWTRPYLTTNSSSHR